MARAGKGDRYHHGDLRAALVAAAAEVIAERGVRNFSLAEASRRLGVAVSAPYAHFAGREELLAAVAVHAYEVFGAEFLPAASQYPDPGDRLAALARGYVRFAGCQRPLFEVLFGSGLDKCRYPEVKAAEKPLSDAFDECVNGLTGGGGAVAESLASAVEAAAHGHAMMLLDGEYSEQPDPVEFAAERAARVTLALVASRQLLG
jgi:AcrR family transcriptional regulator